MNHYNSGLAILIYFTIIIFTLYVFYKKKWFELNDKNLFHQKLFWLSIIAPVFSFIYFGIFSWWGKPPILSAHGYYRFYEISKIPLLLLASSVPLASIVNNIHRTIQTESQIRASSAKNNADLYYSHLKYVCDSFATYPKLQTQTYIVDKSRPNTVTAEITDTEIGLYYPNSLYKSMFRSTPTTGPEYKASPIFISALLLRWEKLQNCIKKYKNNDDKNPQDFVILVNDIEESLFLLSDILKVEIPKSTISLKIDFYSSIIITNLCSEKSTKERIKWLYNLTFHLFDIGGHHVSPSFYQSELYQYVHSDDSFRFDRILTMKESKVITYTKPSLTLTPY